jgi:hypothetical protein
MWDAEAHRIEMDQPEGRSLANNFVAKGNTVVNGDEQSSDSRRAMCERKRMPETI